MKNVPTPQPGKLSEKPTLSVCMIVRDEEKELSRCLKSVQGVAGELIVVDTGSKDNTISIAEDFGARVFQFEWCDDFSAARNESLKYATGDWIFYVDADEELLAQSVLPLNQAMLNPWRLLYVIKCDDGPEAEQRFGWIARLFRNHTEVCFSRPYHESVLPSVGRVATQEPAWLIHYDPSIVIRHYGYAPSELSKRHRRGLKIMKSYIGRHPNDCLILTQLGHAYCGLKRYDEAEPYLRRALKIDPKMPEANYGLAMILHKKGKLDSAVKHYSRAIAGNSLLGEAQANIGAIYVEKEFYDQAIPELKEALAINPDMAWARSNLGLAYISKGMYDAGIEELRQAIAMAPDLANAHMNLGMAYTKRGMLKEGLIELKQAVAIDPHYAKANYNLAVAYYKSGNHKKAIEHCDKAMKLGMEIHPQLLNLLKPHR